jgi:Icc-related predicted phosphoesterase
MKCPSADLYIFTGDMLSNYSWPPNIPLEIARQTEELKYWAMDMKDSLGSPDAPIVCVRGNHDYISLAPVFKGCNLVHEFTDNARIEINGISICGHRGIPYINGYFSDEFRKPELIEKFKNLPEADIVVTHYPADCVLDAGYGLEEIANHMMYSWNKPPKYHCFGHIHEMGGQIQELGGIRFSNAACTMNVLEL